MPFTDENEDIERVKQEDEMKAKARPSEDEEKDDDNILNYDLDEEDADETDADEDEEVVNARKKPTFPTGASSISLLAISVPLIEKLRSVGIEKISELENWSRSELMKETGMSKWNAQDIGQALSSVGFHLKREIRKKRKIRNQHSKKRGRGEHKTLSNLLPPKVVTLLQEYGLTKVTEVQRFSFAELGRKIGNKYYASVVSKAFRKAGLPLKPAAKGGWRGGRKKTEIQAEKLAPVSTPEAAIEPIKENYDKQEYFGYIVGFAHCDIQARIHQFAASTGGQVAEHDLSRRLGELLLGEEVRQVLGAENPVS
jgi:hypothetical protein